jgi:hypothetical protein
LWVIHRKGLCPSSGDINRLMMMMMKLHYVEKLNIIRIERRMKVFKNMLNLSMWTK